MAWRTLGAVRQQELQLSCQILGVRHAICWDYGDGTLDQLDRQVLVRDIVRVIREFQPDIVLAFGPDGGYGHPDHIVTSFATTEAVRRAGDPDAFPDQIAAGLTPHQPGRYYQSYFPTSRMLLLERLVQWLVQHKERFYGSSGFVQALLLLSEESSLLHYASDFVEISWYPRGFYIIEQGEPATKLYLILSGLARAVVEQPDGTLEPRNHLEPGMFFGEQGLAYGQPRNAHVVAVEGTTCLVFSPAKRTAYEGRGKDAIVAGSAPSDATGPSGAGEATTCVDVRAFVCPKLEAMAAHRSQFAFDPDMLPLGILQELFGREYFVRAHPVGCGKSDQGASPEGAGHLTQRVLRESSSWNASTNSQSVCHEVPPPTLCTPSSSYLYDSSNTLSGAR
jgi:LmbE family N-acetylglucosaminyl deacetylase